jgi:hypothetical protein
MWPQTAIPDRGTHFFLEATNSMNLLDEFMVTRVLVLGVLSLQLDAP